MPGREAASGPPCRERKAQSRGAQGVHLLWASHPNSGTPSSLNTACSVFLFRCLACFWLNKCIYMNVCVCVRVCVCVNVTLMEGRSGPRLCPTSGQSVRGQTPAAGWAQGPARHRGRRPALPGWHVPVTAVLWGICNMASVCREGSLTGRLKTMNKPLVQF